MAQSRSKISLSASRDIPFDKLVLSQANVRRIKAGVAVEELAEDIARRTLLQSLTARPVLDAEGAETGLFEVPAGGRRYRALELLVRQKRLARTAPVPCVIRTDGDAVEDSLAENVQRAPLHPLDQFRAFLALREQGRGEEAIAATFFVSVAVVRQRLRLASVAPALLEVYAEDGMTLDQLMAFTVNPDHERQEQVWAAVRHAYSKEPYQIRRMLTEGAVRAQDKRALCVGVEAYEAAGGTVLRDLFGSDGGGWLQDPLLLDRLVVERLEAAAEAVRGEGWRWTEVAVELAYGHAFGLRRIAGQVASLSEEEAASLAALRAEHDRLETANAGADELPDEASGRLTEIEAAIDTLLDRPPVYAAEDVARAGVFVTIDGSGKLQVERGFVRPEDEAPIEPEPAPPAESEGEEAAGLSTPTAIQNETAVQDTAPAMAAPEADEGIKPLPDRLVAELTAHRTLALRHALGERPEVALLAVLHALCLKLFYVYGPDSCLEIEAKSVAFAAQPPGLGDTALARAVDERHRLWAEQLPQDPGELWGALVAFDGDSRLALLAHAAAQTVNAVVEPYNRRPRAVAHADELAEATELDMVAAGWRPTVAAYLGRVTKARILQAVGEAKGAASAQLIDHLRKDDMAEQAEALLGGTGWLPEPLRTAGYVLPAMDGGGEAGPGEQSVDVVAQDEESETLTASSDALAVE